MIIFLYGPDDYRRQQKKKELIAEFCKKHSVLGLGCFDFAEAESWTRFQEFVKSQSIFEPHKLAVLENTEEIDPKELAAQLKPLAKEKNITILISGESKPAKTAGILSQEFDYLKGAEWREFVLAEAKAREVNLSGDALNLLSAVYQNNSWGLITELEKISFLEKRVMQRSDLEYLEAELSPDFWGLINGIGAYRVGDKLTTLEKIFAAGEPAGKVFNILAYQRKEKLPLMAAYDLAVKSGKMDYEEVLLDLAIS